MTLSPDNPGRIPLHRLPPAVTLAAVAVMGLGMSGCAEVQMGRPEALWLLWAVPALAVFLGWSLRRRRRRLERFADASLLPRLVPRLSRGRLTVRAVLLLLGLTCAILALAEPRWGYTWQEVERRGVDLVVALDVSDSMLVEDAGGGGLTRLERARREIADLLDRLEGDRVGLVAFSGIAFVQCPLTLDYNAARLFLDSMDTDLIPVKGTALGAAVRTSLGAFRGASHPSRAILLITDGEDHTGEALEAARLAQEQEVRIFAIGIGRDEGSPIPAPGGGFRRDERGEIVLSRLDEPTLQQMALSTGGRYVRSVTGDLDLEQIYAQGIKATLEDQELGSRRRRQWHERFQWLLALALAALMLEPLIPERRRGGMAGAALWAAVALLPTASVSAQETTTPAESPAPREDPWRAYQQGEWDTALQGFLDRRVEAPEDDDLGLAVGSSQYRLERYGEAAETFAHVARGVDPEARFRALYNLGNTAYRQGRLEEAVELYRQALDLQPDDQDTKYNLEFVQRELERRRQEQQQRQEQQDQNREQGEEGQNQQQDNEADPDQQGQQEQQEQLDPQRPTDQDRDGLPDATEEQGENPTDPRNPDTDGDGLPDGREDKNANGRLDEGETDPNQRDTDGDGVPDGEETPASGAPQPQPVAPEVGRGLTPEEALRYLMALEEQPPERQPPEEAVAGRPRPRKDW